MVEVELKNQGQSAVLGSAMSQISRGRPPASALASDAGGEWVVPPPRSPFEEVTLMYTRNVFNVLESGTAASC